MEETRERKQANQAIHGLSSMGLARAESAQIHPRGHTEGMRQPAEWAGEAMESLAFCNTS